MRALCNAFDLLKILKINTMGTKIINKEMTERIILFSRVCSGLELAIENIDEIHGDLPGFGFDSSMIEAERMVNLILGFTKDSLNTILYELISVSTKDKNVDTDKINKIIRNHLIEYFLFILNAKD